MIKYVVDCMGGDNGAKPIIEACKEFLKENPDSKITLVGNKEEFIDLPEGIEIIESTSVVPMEAGALEVMRMKDSSMYKAVSFYKESGYDAVISCGSSGGFLSTATLLLKNIEGVSRAALVTPFPTKIKGKKVVILDVGASNENTVEHLVQFALMGSLYSRYVLGVEEPKVYLLSNGSEDHKGSPVSREAFKKLKESNFPGFKGNIEARNVLYGEPDVVVTDGFSGNVLLKSNEGMAKMMAGFFKAAFKRNLFSKISYLGVRKGIKEISETMDYKSIGGAMLIGVNGIVVKAHGNSDVYSFKSALNVAKKLAEADITNKIKEGIKNA